MVVQSTTPPEQTADVFKMSDYEYLRQTVQQKLVREAFMTALQKAGKEDATRVMAVLDNSDPFVEEPSLTPPERA